MLRTLPWRMMAWGCSVGVLAGLLAVAFELDFPGKICEYNQATKHEDCATYSLFPFLLVQIGKTLNDYGVAITALATVFIGIFTLTLKLSTDKLWKAAKDQIAAAENSVKIQSAEMNASIAVAKMAAEAATIGANAAKQSADVAERTFTELERPYIFVDTPKFIPSLVEGRPQNIQYILRNYGRTPAIVRWLTARAQTEPPSTKGPTWIEFFNGQIVFKPGDEREIEPIPRMPTPYPIRDVVIRAIEEPTVLLIIEVTYSDVFDYVHVSEFTFFESRGSFHAIPGKKYNRSKSEKLPDGVEWTPAWSERQR